MFDTGNQISQLTHAAIIDGVCVNLLVSNVFYNLNDVRNLINNIYLILTAVILYASSFDSSSKAYFLKNILVPF